MALSLLLDVAQAIEGERLAIGRRNDNLSVARLAALAGGGATVVAASGARTLAFLGVSGLAFPVALFASARSGVPLAPLNYRLPPERLRALIERLDNPLVIVDEAFAGVLGGTGADAIPTSVWLARCAAAQPAPPRDVDDSAPAVLLFTSGTTSEPKCVVLRHENLQSYVLGTVESFSSGAEEAALVSVPPYHVAGVGTVLTNVFAGRRLLYLPDFTPREWLGLVHDEDVTFAMVVPTMLDRIVDAIGDGPVNLPTLRTIAYGGARMPRPVLERALRLLPDVGFVNAYGLTETSSTIAVLGPDEHRAALNGREPAARARLGSAGRLIPGIEGQIRDARGTVLPPGEAGDLWVRGAQVSGEYEGIGSVVDENGWFPTHDRASFDSDGYLFVDGRADDVIIRGGENIAPAEIEDVLLRHPQVAQAAVIGVPDEEWGESIVAFVVPSGDGPPDAGELRAWVRDRLRSSRTPRDILFRAQLPHTDTGKLLRRLLAAEFADPARSSPQKEIR
jgi:acyl-CoA synthetase (AMP-forming)/AMP-acid ligase II